MRKNNNSKLVPVVLCGGAGSRLWPLSREQHPKPFIKLNDGESLLQKAYLRACHLGVEQVLTITNRDLFFKVEDSDSELESPPPQQRRQATNVEKPGGVLKNKEDWNKRLLQVNLKFNFILC